MQGVNYAQRPLLIRPEKRRRWVAWFVPGFLIPPLLIVSLIVGVSDRLAYRQAERDYRDGNPTNWYADGLSAGGRRVSGWTYVLLGLIVGGIVVFLGCLAFAWWLEFDGGYAVISA